jgi:hypothetical protein
LLRFLKFYAFVEDMVAELKEKLQDDKVVLDFLAE